MLDAGAELPWSQSAIGKAFSAMQVALGATSGPTWAISSDGESVAFSPAVLKQDVLFHSGQWLECVRSLRMAKAASEETQSRLAEAEAKMAAIKDKMIWSPV